MQIATSEKWKAWSDRMEKCGYPPNLGLGGTVVAALVTSFFAAHVADAIFVICAFGPHAFFIDGLRVADWKHGVLSTGAKISSIPNLIRGLLTLPIWIAFIGASELCASLLTGFLMHRPRWMAFVARILGGSLLLLFVAWCWIPSPVFHPVPIAAFIGGLVLIWKGVASVFRGDA